MVVKALFFQAEDGIRDRNVTGVQTCALPSLKLKQLRFITLPLPLSGSAHAVLRSAHRSNSPSAMSMVARVLQAVALLAIIALPDLHAATIALQSETYLKTAFPFLEDVTSRTRESPVDSIVLLDGKRDRDSSGSTVSLHEDLPLASPELETDRLHLRPTQPAASLYMNALSAFVISLAANRFYSSYCVPWLILL
eukprot:TRINITY_DN37512_c0_g1_i1.p1 TRINITY_DN37512_c0_g1~~TRINITY_DN37512_c0_g1_i1.p1  ORF type:complete len:195 (-),score=14.29 TRINITY_DN37512_c0_g1_i1:82-666(-)